MVDFLYGTALGRMLLKIALHSGVLKLFALWTHTKSSKILIPSFIKRNHIDMREFAGQSYKSYADFFARKKEIGAVTTEENALISPCDSLVSIFQIKEGIHLPIKNSLYKINDLIPDEESANQFKDGLCLIFRLRASDYHHFCYVDDCYQGAYHFIEGLLHSVQPIACDTVPVYRLNRRVWSVLQTKHFGNIAQIEVGALLVGGMCHEKEECDVKRGEEMGHFDLVGSTIIQLFTKDVAEKLEFAPKLSEALNGETEVEVTIGEIIGRLPK